MNSRVHVGHRISIHALTRSATIRGALFSSKSFRFQSTHSRGVRLSVSALPLETLHFNPRTHEECDTYHGIQQVCWHNFNPRTHEECDAFRIGGLFCSK